MAAVFKSKQVIIKASPVSGTYPSGTARQLDDHARIGEWLAALFDDDPDRLRATMNGLRIFLTDHFVHEESDEGLFAMLREARGKERQLEALHQEHAEMLERLDRLSAQLERSETAVDEMTKRQIRDLVELIRAHEEWETSLLHEAVTTDVGGSG